MQVNYLAFIFGQAIHRQINPPGGFNLDRFLKWSRPFRQDFAPPKLCFFSRWVGFTEQSTYVK